MTQAATARARQSGTFNLPDSESERYFRECLDKEPFLFTHSLDQDVRLSRSRLAALARRLPLKYFDSGNLAVQSQWDGTNENNCSFEEAIERLESSNSWIILKKAYEDAEYLPLLDNCLQQAQELSGRDLKNEIKSRTMSVVMTSPGRVTPYHLDSDCNFLFQIQGNKMIYVFNPYDSDVISQQELERFWKGEDFAAKYRESAQDKAWAFHLKPGLGVHIPVSFPHWVRNGPEISISVSINFKFDSANYDVYRANDLLRRFGVNPTPVGKAKSLDSAKAGAYALIRNGASAARRLTGKRGGRA